MNPVSEEILQRMVDRIVAEVDPEKSSCSAPRPGATPTNIRT